MKNSKKNKSVKIILVAFCIIAVLILMTIVGLSKQNIQSQLVSAGETKDVLAAVPVEPDVSGDSEHTHTYTNAGVVPYSGTQHRMKQVCACGAVRMGAIADCIFENNGKCVCGNGTHTHTYTNAGVVPYSATQHRIKQVCSCGAMRMGAIADCIFENGICTICGNGSGSGGSGGNGGSGGSGGSTTCTEHTGGKHSNWGTCTNCGVTYQTHGWTDEFYYKYKDGNLHTVVFECQFADCDEDFPNYDENHFGGKHDNNGMCEGCGEIYQTHGWTDESYCVYKDENTHTFVFECMFEQCDTDFPNYDKPHAGASHPDGECNDCGYQYQTHSKTNKITGYTDITAQTHTPLYACSYSGCTETYKGTAVNHTGATHSEGKCACGKIYETHGLVKSGYSGGEDDEFHYVVYRCSVSGCSVTESRKERHTGGNHPDGKCAGCGQKYQTHSQTQTIKGYTDITDEKHTPLYACSYQGCVETYKGTAVNHTGATHPEGKCDCGQKYQTHSQTQTITGYTDKTIETHTPLYACSYSGCTETYKGTAVQHLVEEGNWNDNGNGTHSGKCACGIELLREHNYDNGKCSDCGATEPKKECDHSYTINKNTTQHWEECTICEQVKEGTLENHIYEKYVDNEDGTHSATCTKCEYKFTENHEYGEDGKCKDCEALKPEEKCEHKYEMKNDDTNHWEECTECKEKKEGTLGAHTYEKYVDNGDGTHSATCTKCEYKFTKNHEYGEDEKCKDCEVLKPEEKCEHKYEMKNDDTNHWEECTECKEKKEGTLGAHTYEKYVGNGDGTHSATCTKCEYKFTENHEYGEDGKCIDCGNTSSNGNKDNTTSNNEIPKAGKQGVAFIVMASLAIVCIIANIKLKKYKNI